MPKKYPVKTYLGDSVYAAFEDGMIRLTTENGHPDDPRNVIYLELAVFDSLVSFARTAGWTVISP